MRHGIGQILRAVGLVIELVGVIAVVTPSRTDRIAGITLPRETWITLGWAAAGGGFVIWLIGRIMIRSDGRAKGRQT
jgi:hypothetical protein